MAKAVSKQPIWVNQNHPTPPQKAPPTQVGVLGWLRANLFSSVGNSILTLVTAYVAYLVVTDRKSVV